MQYYSFQRISPKEYFRQYPITAWLIIINVIIFLAELFTGGTSGLFLGSTQSTLVQTGGLYPPAVRAGEGYRLITSMFLHSGILHILFNMLTLYSVGTIIEQDFKKWQYLVIYFVSGLCGGLMTCLIELSRGTVHLTVGASGAIFGLFGALLGESIRYKDYHNVRSTLLNIVWMLLPGIFSTGVSVTSHLGGVLGGLLLGLLLTHTKSQGKFVDYSNNPWEYSEEDHQKYFRM